MLHFNKNLPHCALLLIVLATTASIAFGQEQLFPIFVRTLSKDGPILIPVEVKLTDSVCDLKEKIENMKGLPIFQQRLIYGGKQLQDWETISSYNIQKYDKIYLLLRLRDA